MFDLIGIVSIVCSATQAIKDAFTPRTTAENWANKELYYKDVMNGVPAEQRLKNVQNGKYKMINSYPEPHRDPVSGKIIIENNLLYKKDLAAYGAVQTMQWVKQGKYNLTPEELNKEKERIKKEFENLYRI